MLFSMFLYQSLAVVALFNIGVAIGYSASMVRLVMPRFRGMAICNMASVPIATGMMVIDHNHSMITPVEGTKKEIGPYVHTSIPMKVSMGMYCITIKWCPVYRRIIMPAPAAIDDTRIIVRNVDNLSLSRLYDDLIVLMGDQHVLHLR